MSQSSPIIILSLFKLCPLSVKSFSIFVYSNFMMNEWKIKNFSQIDTFPVLHFKNIPSWTKHFLFINPSIFHPFHICRGMNFEKSCTFWSMVHHSIFITEKENDRLQETVVNYSSVTTVFISVWIFRKYLLNFVLTLWVLTKVVVKN